MAPLCGANYYPDPVTFICTPCIISCHLGQLTSEECARYCPGFFMPTTMRQEVTTKASSWFDLQNPSEHTLVIAVLLCTMILLVGTFVGLVYFVHVRISQADKTPLSREEKSNLITPSEPYTQEDRFHQDDYKEPFRKTKPKGHYSSEKCILDESLKESKVNLNYSNNNDFGSGSSSASESVRTESTAPVNDLITRRPILPENTSLALFGPAKNETTTPKTTSEQVETTNSTYLESCVQETGHVEESLVIQLMSSECDAEEPEMQPSSASCITEQNSSKWNDILRLYNEVEAQLTRYLWIVGCMISSECLEVVVDLSETELDVNAAYTRLCANLTQELIQHLKMTEEGPSIVLCHGVSTVESSSMWTVASNRRRKSAVMTFCASVANSTYLFSVAHFLDENDEKCEVANKNLGMVSAQVETKIDASKLGDISNIQKRFFDMAILKIDRQMKLSNNFILPKLQSCIQVNIMNSHPTVTEFLNMKTLVLTRSGEFKAKISKGHFVRSDKNRFILNLMEMIGPGFIAQGDSGTLVTSLPDQTKTAHAFAYVVGCSGTGKSILAVPLWPTLEEVCQHIPGHPNLLQTKFFSTIEDTAEMDSAYVSQI